MDDAGEVLTRMLSSEVKAELLLLFHKNPGLIDSSEGTARRIGRTAAAVEVELKDLVALGVLGVKKIGTERVYSLDRTRDQEIKKAISNYLRDLEVSRVK